MIPSPVDIVLIVDHKWRDLPGMAALAVILEDTFGVSTELIPYDIWKPALLLRQPQVITLTHMNGSRSRAIVDLANCMGTRAAVIQTEGRPNTSELMEYAVGQGVDTRGVDLWFAWSDTIREFMLERKMLPPQKIVVGGCPRFDFYQPPLNRLLMTKQAFAERYGLDPRRPLISWATNFTCTKYHRQNQGFLIKDWTDLGLTRWAIYSEPAEFARRDYEAREQSLEAVRTLLRERPEVQVAIKPHPTEDHDVYLMFARVCRAEFGPRVVFIDSEYIWDVLNATDVHLHRLCTTGVEAWFLDVPSIDLHLSDYFGWSVRVKGAASEAVAGNDLVQNADELIERVDYYLQGGKPSPAQLSARQQYVARWLHRVDGGRLRVHAEALAKLAADRRRVNRRPVAGTLTNGLLILKRKAAAVAGFPHRLKTGRLTKPVDRLGQVDRRISRADVERWKERVRAVLRSSESA